MGLILCRKNPRPIKSLSDHCILCVCVSQLSEFSGSEFDSELSDDSDLQWSSSNDWETEEERDTEEEEEDVKKTDRLVGNKIT